MSNPEQGFNLDGIIKWYDLIKGVGEVALDFVTKQFLHETPSEHFHETET